MIKEQTAISTKQYFTIFFCLSQHNPKSLVLAWDCCESVVKHICAFVGANHANAQLMWRSEKVGKRWEQVFHGGGGQVKGGPGANTE